MEKKTDSTEKKNVKLSSASDLIWNEIKDKSIDMFALPEQKVHMYVTPIDIEPSKLYLKFSASAVLPALETALGAKFSVERVDRFITVTKK